MENVLGDGQLAERIGAGADREAEAELFQRMAGRVRLYGLRHLRNETAADDLAQQVMLIVIEALRAGRLQEPEKVASFVLGTARLTVMDQRRSTQRKQKLLDTYAQDVPMPAPVPLPTVNDQNLARCVQGLREREKAVVVLSFYKEEAGGNVADFLGVSEANVRVIRHRAILQLRECMGVAA